MSNNHDNDAKFLRACLEDIKEMFQEREKLLFELYKGMGDCEVNTLPEETIAVICECGTNAGVGQNHSSWCDMFKSEF